MSSYARQFVCCLLSIAMLNIMIATAVSADSPPLRAELWTVGQVTAERLQVARQVGVNTIVLWLDDAPPGDLAGLRARGQVAAQTVLDAGLQLGYWIEIAYCPRLADAHPQWMASLQGHGEWRRLFAGFPEPRADQIVKNYPWVPILYRESFAAHQQRVEQLVDGMPIAQVVLLNGLQAAPSACGCGNLLCRWTTDYGPLQTATPYGATAAADFVRNVQRGLPSSRVIPVWVTECEEHDAASEGACAGVGCFDGLCWQAYCEQLEPLARQSDTVAVLVPFRAWQRDDPRYGPTGGWIKHALGSFQSMPPRHNSDPIAAARLIAVVQGWQVSDEDVQQQLTRAREAGAQDTIVARSALPQDWQPRIVPLPK